MFTPGELLPLDELRSRHARLRTILAALCPDAGGILVTGNPNLYYMTGTQANGLLWLPLEGEPVLAVRKGLARAAMESPLREIVAFRSYKELPELFREAGSPLSPVLAADQAGVSWEQGRMLCERLSGHTFVPGDLALAKTRAVKSPWELAKIRESCRRLYLDLRDLAHDIRPGMSERAISHALWARFFASGHAGPTPTGMHGSTVFLGHIGVGENGNYPSAYDGPLGLKGEHPAAPGMGHALSVWKRGQLLIIDTGFNFEGYLSDRTQIYFSGKESDIPDVIRKAQDAAVSIAERASRELRPGARPSDIYKLCLELADKAGYAEGFMGLGDNKVRFVGHGIGLTVSEWPVFARSFDEPLQEGMIIALEPKIGLPGIAMVGVEDTWEITDTGAKCLTGNDGAILCV